MPPRLYDTGDDLSLRHLPDSSNASFSFQIPNALSKGDLLLGDDEMSFFRDANDSMATPGPSRTASKPLTLSDLTPRPIHTQTAPFLRDQTEHFPPIPHLDMPSKPKSKRLPRETGKPLKAGVPTELAKPSLKAVTQSSHAQLKYVSSPLETRYAEVQKLNDDLDDQSLVNPPFNRAKPYPGVKTIPVEPKREPSIAKPKRAVIAGGISKTRRKNVPLTTTVARHVPSVPNSQQSLIDPKAHVALDSADLVQDEQNPDASICSTTTGGVAERLVMYSQTLLGSFGPAMSENIAFASTINPDDLAQHVEVTPEAVNVNQVGHGDDRLLTVSQISPSKPASPRPASPASVRPISPLRGSTKRPVSVASTNPAVKKSKNTAVTANKQPAVVTSALQTAARVRVPAGSSSSGSRNARATIQARTARVPKKSTRQVPASTITRPVNSSRAEVPVALARHDASGSSSSTLRFSRPDNLVTSGSSAKTREAGRSTMTESANLPQSDKRVVLPVNSTKPFEFKFQLDARLEARKAEYEKERSIASQKPRKQNYHVPDFKTLHALQEAKLALRKENIVPVISLPLELNTDGRARERELFDEHVREKERELEEAMERRRKEREENEEREIKELRKQAVPKAHEVPEWYKDAPRRKTREVDSNGD